MLGIFSFFNHLCYLHSMACVDNVYFPFIKPNVDDEYGDYSDEDYKDYDECKGGSNSIKELDNYTMSIHDKFKEMKDISKNDNWKHAKHCCPDHSYVFQDLCEVHLRRFTEMFMQTFYKMIRVYYQ